MTSKFLRLHTEHGERLVSTAHIIYLRPSNKIRGGTCVVFGEDGSSFHVEESPEAIMAMLEAPEGKADAKILKRAATLRAAEISDIADVLHRHATDGTLDRLTAEKGIDLVLAASDIEGSPPEAASIKWIGRYAAI